MGLFDIYKTKRLGAIAASAFDTIAGKMIGASNLFDINDLSTISNGVTWTVKGSELTIVGNGAYNYQSVGCGSATDLRYEPGKYRIKGTIVSNSNTAVYSRIGFRNSSNSFQSTNQNLKTVGDFDITAEITTDCYFGICVNGNEANHAATVVIKDIVVKKL